MEKPLVSIIVLTYRNFQNIKENTESILRQDYTNIEVVIADDGSDNFDCSMIEKLFDDKGNNIRDVQIIHSEINKGTVENYANAIRISRGKYIIPLSQDDIFYSDDSVTQIVDFFETTGAEFITSIRIGSISKTELPTEEERHDLCHLNNEKLLEKLFIENIISGATLCFKKNSWEEARGFDTDLRLIEDYAFVLNVLLSGSRIELLNLPTIVYGEQGISSNSGNISVRRPIDDILDNDRIVTAEKYILPNLSLVKDHFARRYIVRKHLLLKHRDNTILCHLIRLAYCDAKVYTLRNYERI